MIAIDAPNLIEMQRLWAKRVAELPEPLIRRLRITGKPHYPLLRWSEPMPTRDTGDIKRLVYLSPIGTRVLMALKAEDGLVATLTEICHEIEAAMQSA